MTYVYNSQLDAFTLYHLVQEEERPKRVIGPALPALGHATSGALGTAVSKLITYPLDLIITRLQVQKHLQKDDEDSQYDGILDAIEKIYQQEGGISAFYSGVIPETIKGITDSFLFFLAYTYARQRRLASQGTKQLSTLDEIGVGVVAGAFAKFWTTPLQNIVTRKQAAAMIAARDPMSSTSSSLSVKDIALQIVDEKGLQGFWSGYSATLILTLNPSLTFLLQGVLERLFVSKTGRSNPGARVTFLLAAVSKAMASTITYPFSLAKTRAQVSSQKPTEKRGPTSEKEAPHSEAEAKALHARQRTVISTIIRIAKTEGVSALYQGLGAEILKAFFSHGITMLAKERIHTMVIQLYYLVLRSLKKFPSPEELASLAKEQTQNTYSSAFEQAKDVYSKGAEVAGDAAAKAQEQAGDFYEKSRSMAESAASKAQDVLQDSKQQAGDLYEKSKDAANDALHSATQTAEDASAKAQEVIGNSTQQAGEYVEKAGKQMQEWPKPDIKGTKGDGEP